MSTTQKEYANKNSSVNIGDIFYTSWGYDQTNIDFYQVLKLIGKSTISINKISKKHIESEKFLSGSNVIPRVNNFISSELKRRVSNASGSPSVNINSHIVAYLWEGQPMHADSYY